MSSNKRALVDLSGLPVLEGRVYPAISIRALHRAHSDPVIEPVMVQTYVKAGRERHLQYQIDAMKQTCQLRTNSIREVVCKQELTAAQENSSAADLKTLPNSAQ